MAKSSPSTQTVTSKTEVDPLTQQWRSAIFNQGNELLSQGAPEYYPGSTVVPYAPQTIQGLNMMQANAQGGAVGLPQAYDASMRAMSGYNPGAYTAMQAANGNMQNPNTGAISDAANQNVAGQVQPMVGTGTGANPYTGNLAQAGQQGAAGSVQSYLDRVNGFLDSSPYAGQIAQTGERPTTMGVDALGSFADAQNPYLDQMFQQGAAKITDQVNSQFSQAGRTGANAAYGGTLADSLGGLYTSIYAPAYENAQNRSLQAAGQLAGIDQSDRAAQMSGYESAAGMGLQGAGLGLQGAGLYGDTLTGDLNRGLQGYGMAGDLAESGYGRQLQGADLYGGLLNSDATRRYQGASDLASLSEAGFDRQLQGSELAGNMWSQGNEDAARSQALLPSLYQYGNQPAQDMIGVGGAYENLNREYLDADMARYNYNQNADWDMLSRYAGLMNGLPDFSSQTQTTTGQQGGNRAMGALGGAASGASMGSMFGPWGTAIGAGVGGLMGLFG